MLIAAAIELITLHMVDGRAVQINPREVTQLVHPRDEENRALIDSVNCVVRFTDGGFVSVAETCEEVEKLMEGLKP